MLVEGTRKLHSQDFRVSGLLAGEALAVRAAVLRMRGPLQSAQFRKMLLYGLIFFEKFGEGLDKLKNMKC